MAEKIDYYEVQELAAVMCDMVLTDENEREVEEALCEKFQVDFEMLHAIMEKVTPLIDLAVSPISSTPMIGIGDGCLWIWKREHQKFVNTVLEWMDSPSITRGEKSNNMRMIHHNGKPEFQLILVPANTQVTLKPNADQPSEPKYLIWDSKYVGNSLLFWREGESGYTTDVAKAHRFSYEEAMKIQQGSDRASKVIPLDHCEQIATRQVHVDHLDWGLIGKEVTND